MPTIISMGSVAARSLGFTGRAKKLVKQTFAGNTTSNWVPPIGITKLAYVQGSGSDGTPDTASLQSRTIVTVTYHSSGSVGAGSIQWESVQGIAENVEYDLNTSGSSIYTTYTIHVYPDESSTISEGSGGIGGAIIGSAYTSFSGGWQTTGHIASSGVAMVKYNKIVPGSPGVNSTAFSLTFPGGGVGQSAPVTVFNDVTVVPGTNYTIVNNSYLPIEIAYYQ